MAKSKNHTNHNQNFKAHRNGIKRPRLGTKISTKGVSSRFLTRTTLLLPHGQQDISAACESMPMAYVVSHARRHNGE